MNEIERKALALLNDVLQERDHPEQTMPLQRDRFTYEEALCRAIEQHEAFRQEVSDAAVKATHTMAAGKLVEASGILAAFIIAKPDPLVEVIADYKRTKGTGEYATNKDMANAIRAAIEKRGGKIVWGEG